MVKKWGPWFLMVVVILASLSVATFGSQAPKSESDRIDAISDDVRCPTCRGQSVRESNAPAAQAIRGEIARRVRSGEDDDSIYAYLVSRYGQRVLLNPPDSGAGALVWALPAVGVVIAIAAVSAAMWRWRANDSTTKQLPSRKRTAVVAGSVVLVAIGAGVFVSASSGTRRPGDVATGTVRDEQNERMERAAALVREEKQLDALKVYDSILADDPEHFGALSERGLLLGLVGSSAEREALMQEGKASIERALALRPNDPRALFYRGLVLRFMGEDVAALNSFRSALQADPPPDLRSSIEDFLATAGTGEPELPSTSNP